MGGGNVIIPMDNYPTKANTSMEKNMGGGKVMIPSDNCGTKVNTTQGRKSASGNIFTEMRKTIKTNFMEKNKYSEQNQAYEQCELCYSNGHPF